MSGGAHLLLLTTEWLLVDSNIDKYLNVDIQILEG